MPGYKFLLSKCKEWKSTQMSVSSAVYIASEYCSPDKAADGDFLFLTLPVFLHSLWFVNCAVFISLIELLHVSVLSASLQGLLSWVCSGRNDSLSTKTTWLLEFLEA